MADALEIEVALVGRAQRSPPTRPKPLIAIRGPWFLLLIFAGSMAVPGRTPSAVPRNPLRKRRRPNQAPPR